MRIFSIGGKGFAAVLAFSLSVTGGLGLASPAHAQQAVGLKFKGALEAYKQGMAAYREGWYDLALGPLKFAARKGSIGAKLALATMYAQGMGVRQSHANAFDLYKEVAEKYARISSDSPYRIFAAKALVALGKYYRTGIKEINLEIDERRAANRFALAGEYFGDPEAQYHLAKLYLVGQGVRKNVRRAVNWLSNSAKKNYAPSQALLGQLLWEGTLVRRNPVNAVTLLTLARDFADAENFEWIDTLYKSIVSGADPQYRKKAKGAVARWLKRKESGGARLKMPYAPGQGRSNYSFGAAGPRPAGMAVVTPMIRPASKRPAAPAPPCSPT